MSMEIPAELIKQISSMGVKELLALINVGCYGAKTISYLKEKIREKLDERKYGFVPNVAEAKALFEVNKKDIYLRLKECLGGHWAVDLLRIGIYISKLNDEGKRETIRKIKDNVHAKYGLRGIKILDLGATSIIESLALHLSNKKMRDNLNPIDLALEFDKIIDGWEHVAIFIKKDDEIAVIYEKIHSYMNKYPIFFVFAYGSAEIKASKAIAKLRNQNIIREKRYYLNTYSNIDQAGLQNNCWVFELIPREFTNGFLGTAQETLPT